MNSLCSDRTTLATLHPRFPAYCPPSPPPARRGPRPLVVCMPGASHTSRLGPSGSGALASLPAAAAAAAAAPPFQVPAVAVVVAAENVIARHRLPSQATLAHTPHPYALHRAPRARAAPAVPSTTTRTVSLLSAVSARAPVAAARIRARACGCGQRSRTGRDAAARFAGGGHACEGPASPRAHHERLGARRAQGWFDKGLYVEHARAVLDVRSIGC
jgi:hypothetical protein